MAGDFNSTPSMPPYHLMERGFISPAAEEQLSQLASVTADGRPLSQLLRQSYTHPSRSLASSYRVVKGQEPLLTNYDNYDGDNPSSDCLDYIWFSQDGLVVNNVLDMIDESVIDGAPEKRLPNKLFPSDHLSIRATFTFK